MLLRTWLCSETIDFLLVETINLQLTSILKRASKLRRPGKAQTSLWLENGSQARRVAHSHPHPRPHAHTRRRRAAVKLISSALKKS